MKVLVVLAGGGFLFQTENLLKSLDPSYDLFYVTGHDSSALRHRYPEDKFHLMPKTTSMSKQSTYEKAKGVLVGFFACIKLIKKIKPDAIVCVGSSMSIPLFLSANIVMLTRVKTVFIESITRTKAISKTGRLLRSLRLVSRFYVQWPEMEDSAKNILYKGTVL